MTGSRHVHICNIEVLLRRISFIYVPQIVYSLHFLEVPGQLLLMQRTAFSDTSFFFSLVLNFKNCSCNCCWNLACGLLADLSKCCFPISFVLPLHRSESLGQLSALPSVLFLGMTVWEPGAERDKPEILSVRHSCTGSYDD